VSDPKTMIIAALASVLAAGSACVGGYLRGHAEGVSAERGNRARADLAASSASASAVSEAQSEIDRLSVLAAQTEQSRQASVREIREHTREIIRDPIYSERCLPADAVGLLDEAIAVANGRPAGQSVSAGGTAQDSAAAPTG